MDLFRREDWTLFRTLGTLCQKAGVSPDLMARLVLKELTDNALDAAGACEAGSLAGGGYYVRDAGPGLPADPAALADLFSVRRPLASSKLLRLPTRGALGNGLRVVVGAVLSSGGTLAVCTGGRRFRLEPRDDGTTTATDEGPDPTAAAGARVEIAFGAGIPTDRDPLAWSRTARLLSLAPAARPYKGRPSPWWYDADSFYELLQASGGRTVRELVAELDGCTGGKAGEVAAAYKGRAAADLSRGDAADLLASARAGARQVKPARLGSVGPDLPGRAGAGYGKAAGEIRLASGRGGMGAELPYVVEAWAERGGTADHVTVCVNRTPAAAEVEWSRERGKLCVFGCGLGYSLPAGRDPVRLVVNVVTPYMPITSDGKAPDLEPFLDALGRAVGSAARKARRVTPAGGRRAFKDAILDVLNDAIDAASGDRTKRYSQRQLYYSVRELVTKRHGMEPSWGWFCKVVSHVEAEGEAIPGMYRDERGGLYHPHEGTDLPLGTLAAERYTRPDWTFNKVLYCEKEGLLAVLKSERWAERHDCALMSAKGFASRAVRDVLDLLAETAEPVTFYCIHDADASGTLIYQALQEGTQARAARKAKVVNLGLEPWEAIGMGLEPERFDAKKRRRPVAQYVRDYDEESGGDWETWLQTRRVELNAMTAPQFVAWLDRKMSDATGKVIPPPHVLRGHLETSLMDGIRRDLTDRAVREARVDERARAAFDATRPQLDKLGGGLTAAVREELGREPERHWRQPVDRVAAEIAGRVRQEQRP